MEDHQQYLDYDTYREFTIKLKGKKKFKITNSYGTKEGWRWLKKNKWLDLGQPITENQFGKIIKGINKLLVSRLIKGLDVKFPCRMGKLEIRKIPTYVLFDDNKLVTNLPIDWVRTLKLWHTDKEAENNKTLIRKESPELFKVIYNKHRAIFKNKRYYQFSPTRKVKLTLKDKIINKELDTFIL